ncbi:neutral/alkaline non-lysosomal ceramidase N-terminal domain-containing protein [Rudanella lutea]|uniref:neutral/alkaline non-lysosomal ceramidase N-terminal domain-containing protein n=1 Tax=Rudanella lutea TaxID=451374 RepID=UPI000365FCDA|nr:neutral/alkaline non-lysosomal ceramidase N-terminal domain-containing protein [Rudanella lutea]
MKLLRRFVFVLLAVVGLLALFIAANLIPVDETPYAQTDFYRQTIDRLASLPMPAPAKQGLRAGWAKVNMTPNFTTPTGGYGVRRGKHWSTVHDSIYARATVVDNGSVRVALVALDLLIVPPTVVEALKRRLPEVGFTWEQVYMGAIHSHNSLGGWAPGLVGTLIAGSYEERIVTLITESVLNAIRAANRDLQPVSVAYTETAAPEMVYNRLHNEGPEDDRVRVLQLRQPGGKTATIASFAAHSTIINSDVPQWLSRDWPGVLVDNLEKQTGNFAMYMAGAVGSMGPTEKGETEDAQLHFIADSLTTKISTALAQAPARPDSALALLTLPLTLRDAHVRVSDGWRLRPWLFLKLYGDYPAEMKALRIGPTVLLGMPADFSGELAMQLGKTVAGRGLNLMVTSFNGGYIGYVTPDAYYHETRYETRDMNWFGPQMGAYFTELGGRMVQKVAQP